MGRTVPLSGKHITEVKKMEKSGWQSPHRKQKLNMIQALAGIKLLVPKYTIFM